MRAKSAAGLTILFLFIGCGQIQTNRPQVSQPSPTPTLKKPTSTLNAHPPRPNRGRTLTSRKAIPDAPTSTPAILPTRTSADEPSPFRPPPPHVTFPSRPSSTPVIVEATPVPPTYLPTFFPPKATATAELSIIASTENLTLSELSDRLSRALNDGGYEERSYYWLDKAHAPGFAIITHIEQIHPDGTPVTSGRWSFDLPNYEHFSIASFLKAMIKADPGSYRMIALVVSKLPFEENQESITEDQVAVLNAGPKFLAKTTDSEVVVTEDYHCTAYIYQFERKTRNDEPVFKKSSDVSASAHLKSTPLWNALAQLR
jgi:hypothetical protein